MARTETVSSYSSWKVRILLIAGSVPAAVGEYYFAVRGGYAIAAMLLCFGVWMILDRRPRFVVTEAGVNFRTWGVGVVGWEEFSECYWSKRQGYQLVEFVPKDEDALASRLSPYENSTT